MESEFPLIGIFQLKQKLGKMKYEKFVTADGFVDLDNGHQRLLKSQRDKLTMHTNWEKYILLPLKQYWQTKELESYQDWRSKHSFIKTIGTVEIQLSRSGCAEFYNWKNCVSSMKK